jgi:hypothetical protein
MIINLKQYGASLAARSLAQDICQNLMDSEIILDFKGIESVTPSFCHELLYLLTKEKNCKVRILHSTEMITFQLKKALLVLRDGQYAAAA